MSTSTHNVAQPPCCPSREELDGLLKGELPADRQTELSEHVGACCGCQNEMDAIACQGDAALSQVVKHIDQDGPPSESAFWKALNHAESALTREYQGHTDTPLSSRDVKLDFLEPSDVPGRLGTLGQFDVLRVIGRGGMGLVLHGFDSSLQRDVAIKILDPQLASNDLARQRFCREARAAALVAHDNLVGVHTVDEEAKSGLPYLVMQLVNGESLEQRLRRVGRLSVVEAVRLGMQAAAGLAAAHELGLVHRDIKPGNILIESGTEKVKLTDFGLARGPEDLKLTRTGFVAGTPLYMAPEQARGDDIDARADLFSLGSVLYEALAGSPPFDGKTPLVVLRRVSDEAHVALRRVNPEVPTWLEDIIDKLLAKNPGDRFQTAKEVHEHLAFGLKELGPLSADDVPVESPCSLSKVPSKIFARKGRHFCWMTAGMIGTVFLSGLLIGGGLVWEYARQPALVGDPAGPTLLADPGNSNQHPAEPVTAPRSIVPVRSGAVWAAALSTNGSTIAVGSESGRVSLWSVADRSVLFDLHPENDPDAPAHRGTVWAVEYTADGKELVTAGDDGYIKLWDAGTGKQIKALQVGAPIRSAAVSSSGTYVVIGDRLGTVRVFNILEESQILSYDQKRTVNAVAFSPDELTIASGGTDGSVILWQIPMNRRKFSATRHAGPVYGLSFSPDGDTLVSSSWDQTVIVWDLNSGNVRKQFETHEDGVWAVQFSGCGELIATGGQDGRTKLWNPNTGELLQNFGRQKGTVHSVRFSRDGLSLATGGQDGDVRVWPIECKKKSEQAQK